MESKPTPGQTPEQPRQPETPATPPAAPETEPPDWAKDPNAAYAEVQKLRKEAEAKRFRIRELEEAQAKREADEARANEAKLLEQNEFKTLAEQYKAERDKAQEELAKQTLTNLRKAAAKAVGLPEEFGERLNGTTEEELKADAEALKAALLAQPQTPARPGGTTTPVPGGTPGKETDEQRRKRIFGSGTSTFGGN